MTQASNPAPKLQPAPSKPKSQVQAQQGQASDPLALRGSLK
jgi:hypothetical protein